MQVNGAFSLFIFNVAVSILLGVGCAHESLVFPEAEPSFLYVANVDGPGLGGGFPSISVLHTQTLEELVNIQLESAPRKLALSPNNRFLWTVLPHARKILMIDTSTRKIIDSVSTTAEPWGLSVSPDGREVWVANFDRRNIQIFSSSTRNLISEIAVDGTPEVIKFSPQGDLVFVTEIGMDSAQPTLRVLLVGVSSRSVLRKINLGPYFDPTFLSRSHLEVNSLGDRLAVCCLRETRLIILNRELEEIGSIRLDRSVGGMTSSPGLDVIYISAFSSLQNGFTYEVMIIDMKSLSLIRKFQVGAAGAIAVTSNGKVLMLADGGSPGIIFYINADMGSLFGQVRVGAGPIDIVVEN